MEKPDICSADAAKPLPLFKRFPSLGEKLPRVPLGLFPTPVEKAERLGGVMGLERLYVKRDDLTGARYGGNKVRMLEFLLGGALRQKAREVVTVGFAGSNQALALAIYADLLGLRCSVYLLPQANAHYVRRNLLVGFRHHARLVACGNYALIVCRVLGGLLRAALRDGRPPMLIQPGGSSPLGIAGYVNAAFELKEQIDAGLLPEPALIYVPMGSMGTAVGLTLGLQVAGVKSRVVAVRVLEKLFANAWLFRWRYRTTAAFLRGLDPSFSESEYGGAAVEIRDGFLGGGYARFTPRDVEAADLMREYGGIIMSGT